MKFDGDTAPPQAPHNNLTNVPPPGTPEFDAWIAADKKARDIAGSGINHARAQMLAAEQLAGDKTRRQLAEIERKAARP
jgi:hypothetical protein